MARIKNGILGGFSGKVGTVVGYTINGKEYMRSLPERTKPRTISEKKNNSAFGRVQETLTPLLKLLKVSFKNYGSERGGSKGALSWNVKNAMIEVDDVKIINPSLFKMSGGELPGAIEPAAVLESPGLLRFHWNTDTEQPETRKQDQVLLLAINFDTKKSKYVCPGAFRNTGTETLLLPDKKSDQEWHLYIGFVAEDRSIQSDSQYLGKITT
ncbi:hypothetical protein ACVWYN_000838 [Pedobacter sp. UYP24]